MVKFELVIFDLDGTLIDSKYDLAIAVNYTRSLYGLPEISVEKVKEYIGDGLQVLMEKALPDIGESEIHMATIKFRAYYGENMLKNTKLYPGAKETLNKLSSVKKAVLTNKPAAFSTIILNKLGIDKFFEAVTGGDSGPKRKPDPAPILDLIDKLKVQKSNCLMLGDGKNDILAAKAAGIKCAAAEYGYTKPAELKALSPDFTIKNITELPEIIQTQ